MKATYTFHPQSIDDPIMMTRANGSNYYYMKDGQGSVTTILDENGTIRNFTRYDAFGEDTKSECRSVTWMWQLGSANLTTICTTVSNRYLYTRREYDSESGLYFYRARMYDARLGRFTSEDPILDGNNWYAYVGNNPVNFTDPLGLASGFGYVGPTQGGGQSLSGVQLCVPVRTSGPGTSFNFSFPPPAGSAPGNSSSGDRLSSQDLMPYPRRHDDITPDRIFSGGFQQNTQSQIENSIANSMGGIGDSISQSIAASMSASAGESVGQSQQPTYGQYGPGAVEPSPVLSGSGSPNLSGRGSLGNQMPMQSSGVNGIQNLGSEYISEQMRNRYSDEDREIHRIIERGLYAAKVEEVGDTLSDISFELNKISLGLTLGSIKAPHLLIAANIINKAAIPVDVLSTGIYAISSGIEFNNSRIIKTAGAGVSVSADFLIVSAVTVKAAFHGYRYSSRETGQYLKQNISNALNAGISPLVSIGISHGTALFVYSEQVIQSNNTMQINR